MPTFVINVFLSKLSCDYKYAHVAVLVQIVWHSSIY